MSVIAESVRKDDQLDRARRTACQALAAAAPHKRLSPGAVSLGQIALGALFEGRKAPNIKDDRLLELVRAKFAEACVRFKLTGLPGQSEPWYATAEQAARERRDARRASARRGPVKRGPGGRKPARSKAASATVPDIARPVSATARTTAAKADAGTAYLRRVPAKAPSAA